VGVRGESHDNDDGASRQDIIRRMRAGEAVQLIADPTNEHDRFAVKVATLAGEQIGWLPSDARDASALLRGEPIQATVHAIHGGTTWLKRLLGKKQVGVVLRITKAEPDWGRYSELKERAGKLDVQVADALKLEKAGDADAAIAALREAIAAVRAFTATDPQASAHRSLPAPVDRLSLLLERRKDYAGALALIDEWQSTFDPVQLGKAASDATLKRRERLWKHLGK
jgi:hypothetical protein